MIWWLVAAVLYLAVGMRAALWAAARLDRHPWNDRAEGMSDELGTWLVRGALLGVALMWPVMWPLAARWTRQDDGEVP